MSGLAEILDENTSLRRELASRDEQLRAQDEKLRELAGTAEKLAQLTVKFEALKQGERLRGSAAAHRERSASWPRPSASSPARTSRRSSTPKT